MSLVDALESFGLPVVEEYRWCILRSAGLRRLSEFLEGNSLGMVKSNSYMGLLDSNGLDLSLGESLDTSKSIPKLLIRALWSGTFLTLLGGNIVHLTVFGAFARLAVH